MPKKSVRQTIKKHEVYLMNQKLTEKIMLNPLLEVVEIRDDMEQLDFGEFV